MPARMTWTVGASSSALAVGTSRWPGAHEQLVGEDLAELGQRMADGRGATPQPLGGAGDAGIDQQRVERHQQIGVDFP